MITVAHSNMRNQAGQIKNYPQVVLMLLRALGPYPKLHLLQQRNA